MTPEEQQKADAWMTLHDKDVVTSRILSVVEEAFSKHEGARWLTRKIIEADKGTTSPLLRMYFEAQLERNLRMILAEGVQKEVAQILKPMVEAAIRDHAAQVSKDLAELKKLKSKGPVYGKR